jgi:hypothetical protein
MSGFNLLHYPTLDRLDRQRRRWRSGWIGAACGAMLAGSWVQWQSLQTEALQSTLTDLQARLGERQRQATGRQQQASQNQILRQQLDQLSVLQAQQQAWHRLHSGLLQEARSAGLVLQRLQVEAGRIDIQGQAPSAQAMTRAAQQLAQRWDQPLHLLSLEAVPAQGEASSAVSFVWQGRWPALADGSAPTSKVQP